MIHLRNTVQKEHVHSALIELGNHPTADDVYDRIHAEFPRISRATVYRVLNQLADTGVATRISVPGSAAHFDHCALPHNHVRCMKCGRLSDIEGAADIDIDISKLSAGDFKILGYSLIFDGLCGRCALLTQENADME